MLALDAEKVKEARDTATLLFSRQDSRRAARALVGWLQEKKRRLGKPWCLVPARERWWRVETGRLGRHENQAEGKPRRRRWRKATAPSLEEKHIPSES